ncbi:MAG: hypothetical protein ACI4B5_05575, partial [Bacteroidaceae bacterium]
AIPFQYLSGDYFLRGDYLLTDTQFTHMDSTQLYNVWLNDKITGLQDTLGLVAHNTEPYTCFGEDVTGPNFYINVIVLITSLIAAYFSLMDWRSQKRTSEEVSKQNQRYINFESFVKDLYRSLVYTLAIEYKCRDKTGTTKHFPNDIYYAKNRVFDDLLPAESFINVDGASEPINDLKLQMRFTNIEINNAIEHLHKVLDGSLPYNDYKQFFAFDFDNMSFKPLHLVRRMIITEDVLYERGIIARKSLRPKTVAECILEKHIELVVSNKKIISKLSITNLRKLKLDFKHVRRAVANFKNPEEYVASLAEYCKKHNEDINLLRMLADTLGDKTYSALVNDNVILWDVLETILKIDVFVELKKMQFISRKLESLSDTNPETID